MKRYQAVFSALFLAGLFSLSALNLYRERDALQKKIQDIERPKAASEYKKYTKQLDGILSQTLVGGHRWNELYGTVYRALGKNEKIRCSIRETSIIIRISVPPALRGVCVAYKTA